MFATTFSMARWIRKIIGGKSHGPVRREASACKLKLEILEDRTVPATFRVTNLTDALVGETVLLEEGAFSVTRGNEAMKKRVQFKLE